LAIFCALAERLAMARAPVPSELVEDLENDFPRLMEQRRDFIGDTLAYVGSVVRSSGTSIAALLDDDDAATVVVDEPFPVGATIELHGLPPHPNFDLNGRHVVVVPTPLDVAARGRINVVLDGAVHAVQREYLRAVATP